MLSVKSLLKRAQSLYQSASIHCQEKLSKVHSCCSCSMTSLLNAGISGDIGYIRTSHFATFEKYFGVVVFSATKSKLIMQNTPRRSSSAFPVLAEKASGEGRRVVHYERRRFPEKDAPFLPSQPVSPGPSVQPRVKARQKDLHQTIITRNKDFALDQLLVLTLPSVGKNFDFWFLMFSSGWERAQKGCLTQWRGICLGAAWVGIKQGERTHYG